MEGQNHTTREVSRNDHGQSEKNSIPGKDAHLDAVPVSTHHRSHRSVNDSGTGGRIPTAEPNRGYRDKSMGSPGSVKNPGANRQKF